MERQITMSRRGLLTVIAAVPAAGLVACSSGSKPAPSPTPATIYAVGDSLTEANSPDFVGGKYGDGSWVAHLDPRITVRGGWAKGGARTEDMVAGVTASDAHTLVVLAGSNDTASVPFETTAANLDRIAQKVGAKRVVVSALPPRNDKPETNVAFNANLQRLATDKGWHFIDPMGELRDGNRFAAGMNSDDVHVTVQGATVMGKAMGDLILRLP